MKSKAQILKKLSERLEIKHKYDWESEERQRVEGAIAALDWVLEGKHEK